jgi:hypothetical protein
MVLDTRTYLVLPGFRCSRVLTLIVNPWRIDMRYVALNATKPATTNEGVKRTYMLRMYYASTILLSILSSCSYLVLCLMYLFILLSIFSSCSHLVLCIMCHLLVLYYV